MEIFTFINAFIFVTVFTMLEKLFPMTPPQHYYIFIRLIKLHYLFIHHFISLRSKKTFSYLYFHAITYYLTLSFIFFIYLFMTLFTTLKSNEEIPSV